MSGGKAARPCGAENDFAEKTRNTTDHSASKQHTDLVIASPDKRSRRIAGAFRFYHDLLISFHFMSVLYILRVQHPPVLSKTGQ